MTAVVCADTELLPGQKVTCARNNLSCDLENAGWVVAYERTDPFGAGSEGQDTLPLTRAKNIAIDGGLISGKHPAVAELFVDRRKSELLKAREGD